MDKQIYINLLKKLIETPSFSKAENDTADLIFDFLKAKNIHPKRYLNNVWATNKYWQENKPTILLNSHHDTVKPVDAWTKNPFEACIENEKLYGLGSNDAGASLVCLIATFIHFYEVKSLPFNLIIAASAEEEISGKNGISSLLPKLDKIDLGIVGEPTEMQMAIAEKGLMVIDGEAQGVAGHAARKNNTNAIYKAMNDIHWIQNYSFPKTSKWLENVKMTVTQIEAGTQHNVVPDKCSFVIDVRSNDCYSNQAIFEIIQKNTQSKMTARSFRLNSSSIDVDHPIVQLGKSFGLKTFGSPTLSDQALMSFPTIKIGCGNSNRSHQADEFIYLKEIEKGIDLYIKLLENLTNLEQYIFSNKTTSKTIKI